MREWISFQDFKEGLTRAKKEARQCPDPRCHGNHQFDPKLGLIHNNRPRTRTERLKQAS